MCSLRRVGWVRIVVDGAGATTCEAFGISHRLPAVHRVCLATALSLARQGAPLVVRHAPASSSPAGPAAAPPGPVPTRQAV